MSRPPLPTKSPPKSACRPGWDRTAFAQLSAEQFHLRSSPRHSLTKGSWSEPDGSLLAMPGQIFRAKNGADTPTTGKAPFTQKLHVILHDNLPRSASVNYRKQNEMSAESTRSRNAAKTSDEAGATPPSAA